MAALSVESGRAREEHWNAFHFRLALKRCTQLLIGGYSAADEEGSNIIFARCSERFADEVRDDGALEGRDEVERLPVTKAKKVVDCGLGNLLQSCSPLFNGRLQVLGFYVSQDGSFDSAVGKVEARTRVGGLAFLSWDWIVFAREPHFSLSGNFVAVAVLHPGDLELDCVGIAVGREPVDNRSSGIAEREELGDLVEAFSGGVVASVADPGVGPEFSPVRRGRDACDLRRRRALRLETEDQDCRFGAALAEQRERGLRDD